VTFFEDTQPSTDQGILFVGGESLLGDLDGDSDRDILITSSYRYVAYAGWYTMLFEQR
jgi:hypothetical protein